MNYHRRETCRCCGSRDLLQVLDLGLSPMANAYVRPEDAGKPEPMFPLTVAFCRECSLLQVPDVVNPALLFRDYHFMTGASQPSVEHFRNYVNEDVRPRVDQSDGQRLVVEIGGNDGSLLANLVGTCQVLNVDPASNLAAENARRGVTFMGDFFNAETAAKIVEAFGQADVVVANNVLAHIDDLVGTLGAIRSILKDDGALFLEVHWVGHLIADHCWDQVYFEHLCYHSLHAMQHALWKAGMFVNDAKLVPTQGQSMRITASKRHGSNERVRNLLVAEHQAGLTNDMTFKRWGKSAENDRRELVELLASLKAQGKRIVGYGAPAKGHTLLNYCHIGPETLDYLTDTTTLKQGLLSPGVHIPIVDPKILREDTPDYALLLAWNFRDAIVAKERELLERGMKFIVAHPKLEIVGA